ncbi:hypothetical protein [Streptomyces sp. NPDC056817]
MWRWTGGSADVDGAVGELDVVEEGDAAGEACRVEADYAAGERCPIEGV